MINFGNSGFIDLSRMGFPASSYAPEAVTLFSAMTTQPDATRKRLINDFIVGCKADGNWTLIDGAWFLAAHDSQAAKLNWKNPSSYTITEVNSPTYTVDRGFTPDGTTQYLRTGLNPSVGGLNFSLNSNCFGVYSRTNSNGIDVDLGARAASGNFIQVSSRSSGSMGVRNNSPTIGSVATPDSLGLHTCKRTVVSDMELWKNGVQIGTASVASVAIPAFEIYLNAYNNAGTPAAFGVRQLTFAFVGGNIDISKLYTRVQTYLTAIGANV